MFAATVSRWTIHHFGAALAFFLLAQFALVAGIAQPLTQPLAPLTLATVHLLTIGWLTILMLGALHQFVPVITAQGKVAGNSALVSLLAIVVGLAGMEAGFAAMDGRLSPRVLVALPLGGALVLAGAGIAVVSLARTLWRARPLPFAARFLAAGLVFLVAALGMGIVLGGALSAPGAVMWPAASTVGLRLHLLAGFAGWFTLTAIGVSYRLISMFTLAPEERGHLGTAILALSIGGVAVAWLIGLLGAIGAPVPDAAFAAAAIVTGLGVTLYLIDMVRLYRARRRRKLELNTAMAIPALAALALSLPLAASLCVGAASATTIGALVYLFLFGWLSGLGLSQLYKIVPFLTWLERYGSLLGKQAVPRVQDLVDEQRDRRWFILFFASVAAATVFFALGWPALWRLAALGHLLATLMIVRALWLVRRRAPREGLTSAPPDLALRARPPFAT